MADVFSIDKRRQVMRSIRSFGTRPEIIVAHWLRSRQIRFRRHPKYLPGRPDFVLIDYHAALFIHGCFWHGHQHCKKGRIRPQTHSDFWETKIEGNMRRDRKAARELRKIGFAVLTVWECRLRNNIFVPRLISGLNRIFPRSHGRQPAGSVAIMPNKTRKETCQR